MPYTHSTGTKFTAWNSHKEHCFYEETTKRQMHLIIEQMAELLKSKGQDWVDKAIEERENIKSEQLVCDVCGSTDVIEAPHMGRNCNRCHPL